MVQTKLYGKIQYIQNLQEIGQTISTKNKKILYNSTYSIKIQAIEIKLIITNYLDMISNFLIR